MMQDKYSSLLEQVNKLVLIDDVVPLKQDFILGYVLKNSLDVSPEIIKQLIKVIELLFDILECQLVSKSIFLELIVVISHVCQNLQKHHVKSPIQFYQKTIEQILNNPDYLKNKYFAPKIKILKVSKIEQPKPQKQKIGQVQIPVNLIKCNSDLAECPICMVQVKHQNISVLGCGDIIHKQCFQQCMKQLILNKRFPLKCPFQQCSKNIQSQDIQEYLNKQLVEKYYEFTLHNFVDKNAKNMAWCPTPGCQVAFQFDQLVFDFNCQKCKKSYCLKCKTQAHVGQTCEQNQQMRNLSQQDKKFIQFAKGARYKQCPQCKFWVQKNHGCCHMTCRCSYQFCYRCGSKYGECNCQNQYDRYYGSSQGQGSQQPQEQNEIQSQNQHPVPVFRYYHQQVERQQPNERLNRSF